MEEKLHMLWDHRSGDHVGLQKQRAFWVHLAVPAENRTENSECFIYSAVPKMPFEDVLEV